MMTLIKGIIGIIAWGHGLKCAERVAIHDVKLAPKGGMRDVDGSLKGFILTFRMLPKILLFKKSKSTATILCIASLFVSFVAFSLDIATRDMIAFDVFYFPSIMLITWYLGNLPGCLMVVLTTFLWAFAQADVGFSAGMRTFLSDSVVHCVTFSLVFWLTSRVRNRTMLLRVASQELARSNLELEQFAFKAAHDLQSPLTTLFSYSEFLAERSEGTPGDEKLTLCAKAILKSAKRMSLMIKALLDYAKVIKEEEKAPPVDLAKIVREVVENLNAVIADKKAEIAIDPLPALAMNPSLASILFQNLIGNALKYCENIPRVHVSAVRKDKEWIFSVRDNGIGIPKESRERIFIMFEKLPTKHQYPGSGIGLATCQKIVERYGGRIWVESKSGEGSVFFFTLPAA